MTSRSSFQFLDRFLTFKSLPVLLAVVAVALALPSLFTGWQQDDLVHRYMFLGNPDARVTGFSPLDIFYFLDGDSTHTRALMDAGVIPWWSLETIRLSFWRPLASLSHWLDYLLWPYSGELMHLQSLLWFGSLILATALLYRRFLGFTWVAGLSALFFAVDDAHGLTAGWLANRNALIAGFFGVLALIAHDRWRRDNWRPGRIAGPLLLALALLSGEAALATCAYLFAYALFIDPGDRRARVLSLLPYVFLAALWLIVYSLLGYGTWGSGFYVDPLSEPVRFLEAVAWKAPLLLADQWTLLPSSLAVFMSDRALALLWLWALIVLSVVAILVIPLVYRDRTARFWFTGMVLSIPLVCSTMPHSRLLLFAGVGGFGLLAQWIARIRSRADHGSMREWKRVTVFAMLVFFLVVHVLVAPVLLTFNAVSATFAQPYIQDAVGRVVAGPEFKNQDLVIVNHPVVFYGHYFHTARVLAGQSFPRRVRVLAPGNVPVRVHRPDEFTLVVRPEGGFLGHPFDDVYRGPTHLMKRGDQVSLTGMSVLITASTVDGRPAEAAFRFSVPLEDYSLRWLNWANGGYTSFEAPVVGDSTMVPASPLPF